MTRELDAAVARARGLDVVGQGRCRQYGGQWGVSTGWPREVTPDWPIRPIYVEHCVCSPGAPLGPLMLGHEWACLEVVSCYSEKFAEAWQVVEWMRERGWFIAMEWDERGCSVWMSRDSKNHVGITRPVPAESICHAFLKAMGEEVPD